MKVTVQFGRTAIVVPCGDGTLSVQQLIHQAVQRYCKNAAKDAGYSIKIHHLEYTDGGILDPDDVLIDVVEDKDKLVAVYEEQEAQRADEVADGNVSDRHSPDTFESELAAQLAAFQPITGEIEVTPLALKASTPLLVRRSSDPALVPPAQLQQGASQPDDPANRNLHVKPVITVANWVPTDDVRTEPPGPPDKHSKSTLSDLTKKVEFSGDCGPLGIHVVPFNSTLSGRFLGLNIRGIEENSRSRKENLLQENECIIKINDCDLTDKSFVQAQEVFRNALQFPAVELQIVPSYNRELYEKFAIGSILSHIHDDDSKTKVPSSVYSKPGGKPADAVYPNNAENSSPPISKLSSPKQLRSNNHLMHTRKASSPTSLGGPGTKKQGKKIKIDLKKGSEGLGFTVVTRESSVHGPGPILVKNILPRGAAVKDGRLQSGDRILEVNGIDIMGKTQEELVGMLRGTKHGETVSLVVARQEDVFVPRELKGEQNCNLPTDERKEHLIFEIPLNDSGSAGLGISLKGNKSKETGADLGIFIKAILHGGAAFKDGRLRVNDQLIAVNSEQLLDKSNHEALETLRRSMSMEGNIRGMIKVMVARRIENPQEDRPEIGAIQAHNARSSNSPRQMHTQPPDPREGDTLAYGEGEVEVPPPIPPHSDEEEAMGMHKMRLLHEDTSSELNSTSRLQPQRPLDGVLESQPGVTAKRQSPGKMSGSKSMDLVADESNVGSLAVHQYDSTGKDVGPMLGLKKSSSLESLQTAVAEVRKNELPFHRPRPHMVRGRGCNESFRAAIDKSYDGPEIPDDADSEDSSQSGHETPGSESAFQGTAELEDTESSDSKMKKGKKKKDKKKKVKTKTKEKDKKKENESQEKKVKKKGFGAMLRFGKKKEDKGKEQKIKQKNDALNEEELERMKEERDRIEAKHQELREKLARERYDQLPPTSLSVPDIEDDDMDPNYARVNHFREPPASHGGFKPPSPQLQPINPPRALSAEQENLDGLYAKINKQRPPAPDSSRPNNMERIHQLRKEYHQARREGVIPSYDEHEGRWWPGDYEPPWGQVPVKGPNGRPGFEELEYQYSSTLPRHIPGEPEEYHLRASYGDREPPRYLGAQRHAIGYPHRGNYPRNAADARLDPRIPDYPSGARLREAMYNPPAQYKGPHRHDVPPSPTQTFKLSRYHDQGKVEYRESSPDRYRYPYQESRHQDPRQKNGMTAAV